jgi:hypothetical protein
MAIYDSSSLGTTANRVTFNAYTTFPVYRVRSRMPMRRQIRELDIPIPFESGISDFETLEGQSVYVIEGTMYPGTEAQYDAGIQALRSVASLEIAQDDNLSDRGYVPYIFADASGNKQIFMKVLYVDIREDTRQGLVQPFRLICKVKDPTIFGGTMKTASTQGSDPTTVSGDAVYDFPYPVVYGASTYSTSSIATNNGDLATYPASIQVYGPINTPTITNTTTGESITVSTNLSTASNILTLTYDKDTLTVDVDGNSVLGNVTATSTFFKLQPGANIITLTGASFSSGAYVVVNYYDAWPLS